MNNNEKNENNNPFCKKYIYDKNDNFTNNKINNRINKETEILILMKFP